MKTIFQAKNITKANLASVINVSSSQFPAKFPDATNEAIDLQENHLKARFIKAKFKITYIIENIISQPRWFSVFILGRFNFIRQLYSWILKLKPNYSRTLGKDSASLFPEVHPDRVVDTLKQDGLYTNFSLPSNILQGLLHQTQTQNCFAGGNTDLGFKIWEKSEVDRLYAQPFYVARYFNISSSWSEISQLANDPKLREIADKYIGKQAQYTGASLFWTFPIRGASHDCDQQQFSHFHYDIDDLAGLRFCFYLTDVDDDNGPHLCIRGSHVKKSLLHLVNLFTRIQPAEKLRKFYGADKFVSIMGNSGTGFIEDTFCFHKGIVPQYKPRLLLQLHFAAHNYGKSNYLDDRDPEILQSFRLKYSQANKSFTTY